MILMKPEDISVSAQTKCHLPVYSFAAAFLGVA